jgi:FkbM family methyltransferase
LALRTVIDVGSNIGVVAERFARAVGPTGQVRCFEPFPGSFEPLRQRAAANGELRLVVGQAAVGEKAGSVCLHL